MSRFLQGRVAIVTGGARGIGFAIASRLSREGASLVLVDKNVAPLNRAASLLAQGGAAIGVVGDVTSWSQVEEFVGRAMKTYGRVDVLVNNAGITGKIRPISEVTESEWDEVMDVDLKGTFLCSKAVLPQMIQQGSGSIVNISSISGKEGNANMLAYSAAKGGVIAFTKALAEEVVRRGVRVNCVAPALIQTDLLGDWPPEQIEKLRNKIPMGRFGRPEEVANVVCFLASDEASFITGHCINIDGGRGKY